MYLKNKWIEKIELPDEWLKHNVLNQKWELAWEISEARCHSKDLKYMKYWILLIQLISSFIGEMIITSPNGDLANKTQDAQI